MRTAAVFAETLASPREPSEMTEVELSRYFSSPMWFWLKLARAAGCQMPLIQVSERPTRILAHVFKLGRDVKCDGRLADKTWTNISRKLVMSGADIR